MLGLYLVVLAQRGPVLVSTGSLVPVLLGVGTPLLPVVGAVVRLDVAEDDAGDRRRARAATRRAITLHRSAPT